MRAATCVIALCLAVPAYAQENSVATMVSGRWTGVMEADFAVRYLQSQSAGTLVRYSRGAVAITVDLSVSKNIITGRWNSGGASGSIEGTLSDRGAISLTVVDNSDAAYVDGQGRITSQSSTLEACEGQARFTGALLANGTIHLRADRFESAREERRCVNWPQKIEWKLERPSPFVGIGVAFRIQRDRPTITAVLAGSPADRAGLKEGDVVNRIDGADVKGASITDVIGRIRGERGTSVSMSVTRRGTRGMVELTITREEIATAQ